MAMQNVWQNLNDSFSRFVNTKHYVLLASRLKPAETSTSKPTISIPSFIQSITRKSPSTPSSPNKNLSMLSMSNTK